VSIRVLIVDDQALVRAGFKMILESEPDIEIVGEAEDGLQAVEAARELRPDVALMDIRMPNLDGLEATRRILAGSGDAPRILMLTTFDLDEYVYAALRARVSGFLLKDIAPLDLIAAVRVIAAGESLLAPTVTRRLAAQFVTESSPRQGPASIPVTERERQLLALDAEGLSNMEMGARLYITAGTVKTHIAHLLTKLAARDRIELVIYAYRNGVAGGPDPALNRADNRSREDCTCGRRVEILVNELDGDGALAHGRGDPFRGPMPDIADGEHPWQAGFQG
jgi:DNA-binding NarL/FixJ family response regulator